MGYTFGQNSTDIQKAFAEHWITSIKSIYFMEY